MSATEYRAQFDAVVTRWRGRTGRNRVTYVVEKGKPLLTVAQ